MAVETDQVSLDRFTRSSRFGCPSCTTVFQDKTRMYYHHARVHDESIAGVYRRCCNCDDIVQYPSEAVAEQPLRNFCSGSCRSKWYARHATGSDHHLWEGGASTVSSILRRWLGDESYMQFLDRTRGDECERCGATGTLHNHHIVPIVCGGINHEDLVMTLCPSCHHDADDFVKDVVGIQSVLIPDE